LVMNWLPSDGCNVLFKLHSNLPFFNGVHP
jgi:hypothetical protein